MAVHKALLLLPLLLLAGPEPCKGAVEFLGNQAQVSLEFSLPEDQSGSEDLPLDEAPLVRPLGLAAERGACGDHRLGSCNR